ncbi:hypothetical protein GCM10010310_80300 [Streptomyces violaceolatus]|uniref:Uncharacterized protein n=1 Tax=Streptomyces violaceolatus TaxID=67378 RepID=A0ABN3TIX7_9ACTN
MVNSTGRQHFVHANEEINRQEERGGIDSPVGDCGQNNVNSKTREAYWEALNRATMVAAMTSLSKGNRSGENAWRAGGVALLASRLAQSAFNEWLYKDRHPAMVHALNSIGTAIWSAGFATSSRALHTAGPAVSFTANLVSAGMEFYQGKEGWWRRLIDAAESGLFTVTGITENPGARAGALGATALGFLADSKQESNLVGHALGFSAWAAGAGMEDDALQGFGAGVVAGSELFRLLSPTFNRLVERSPSEVTAPNSSPLLPVHNTTPLVPSRSQDCPTQNPLGSSAAAFAPPGLPPIESGPSFSSMIPEDMIGQIPSPVLPLSGYVVSDLGPVNAPSRNHSSAGPTAAYNMPVGNVARSHAR